MRRRTTSSEAESVPTKRARVTASDTLATDLRTITSAKIRKMRNLVERVKITDELIRIVNTYKVCPIYVLKYNKYK